VKKSVLSVLAMLFLSIGASGAYAGSKNQDKYDKYKEKDKKAQSRPNGGKDKPRAVPEIDAASGTLALAFVGGVLLLGAERLRRRSQVRSSQ